MKWIIEYHNDTGARDEYFKEWWSVTDGKISFASDSEKGSELLCGLLNNQSEGTIGDVDAVKFAEWLSDNYWIREPLPRKTTGIVMWALYEDGKEDILKTTSQLYSIYKGQPQSSTGEKSELEKENERLRIALSNLVFTASSLWDEVKPIKDSDAITVTHPIIEGAKFVLQQSSKGE